MVEKRIIPEFKTEAEEAAWWDENQDDILDDFILADSEDRLPSVPALVYSVPNSSIIHLKPKAIATAKQLAARRGIDYERYVEELFDDALIRDAKAS